jgi:CHASE1-domain containing sensor protein
LLISLLLTALAWYYVRDTVEAHNRVRFNETVRATQAAVGRRTDDYLDAMFGARGLVLASDSVDPREWEEYVKGVEPGSRLGGLQALAFAERVEPSEREAFVRSMKEEGLPGLWPDLDPGGERDVYFPVSLTAPVNEANREMFGRDDYPYTVYRAAMDRARDAGSPQATETTYVLTENPPGANADLARLQGFFVYLPVYEAGEPAGTVAERRQALQGFVVGVFRRDGLLDAVFEAGFDPAIDFEVYDGPDAGVERPALRRRRGEAGRGRRVRRSPRPRSAASRWPGASGACTSQPCPVSRGRARAGSPSSSWPRARVSACSSSASPRCSCAAACAPSGPARTSRTRTASSKGPTGSSRPSPTPSLTTSGRP